MLVTPKAIEILRQAEVLFAPGKAANAGGVAVSGLEMSQNRQGLVWSPEDVENHLRRIIHDIHDRCVEHGQGRGGAINYARGANVAGFIKVADAMLASGLQ